MKNLIYFVVGGDPSYIQLTKFCIHSLLQFNNLMDDDIDILIICDQNYSSIVLKELPFAKIHICNYNDSPMRVSMRKLEIFSYPHIHQYDKLLYLDSDIVVIGSLRKLWKIDLEDDIIYVKTENTFSWTDNLYHGLKMYTNEQIKDFTDNNIAPFNAGQFMLKNSAAMKEHFDNILDLIADWKGDYFFEQSFMNHYFLQNNKYNISGLENFIEFVLNKNVSEIVCKKDLCILHFVNCGYPFPLKLHQMKDAYFHKQKYKACLLESRSYIGNAIVLPNNCKIAEIGVLQGDFSQILYERFKPYMLFLVDPFEGHVSSGDADGNNVQLYDMEKSYQHVVERFKNNSNVNILKAKSTILECFVDNYFDLIYIDGDHSYEGVKYDLEVAYKKIKNNGWICGHDLRNYPAKCKVKHNFQVEKAVWEFCFDKGLYIQYLFMDGCVSYAIPVHKFVLQY